VTKYLLVIQFSSKTMSSLTQVHAFEEKLIRSLPRTCNVDGHDVGSGTTNFFVYTTAPLAAHRAFRKYFGTHAIERIVRVSFRLTTSEQWMNLWPFRDSRPFALIYEDGHDPFVPASKREIPKRGKPGASKFATRARKEW
jgi:hypothetical protein